MLEGRKSPKLKTQRTADADERQLRSKERLGETQEAAVKRQRWEVSEGRTEHGATRFTMPTQGPELRLQKPEEKN